MAAVPQGVVSGYWLGGQPAQSLLPSGHEVKAEEKKKRGGGDEEEYARSVN